MSHFGFKEFAKDLIEKINSGASESDVVESLSVGYSIIKGRDKALNLARGIDGEAVVKGCCTCRHNPNAPYVPEICEGCDETFSNWQPFTDC